MATIWEETYKQFAEDMSNAIEDPANGVGYIYNSLLTLIDMDSSGLGVDASVDLLKPLNLLYLDSLRHAPWNEPKIRIFIAEVNNFTIRNVGDLTTFVNEIVWDEGCIPYNWWSLSEEAGFDTSEWVGCSS